MFMNFVLDFEREHGGSPYPRRQYIPFKSYPVSDYCALVDEVATYSLPHLTMAEARRQIGLHIYPAFAETMVGTALFAVAGHDFQRVLTLGSRAYEVSVDPCMVEVSQPRPGQAFVRLRDIWSYVDTLHLGIWQGAMKRCGVRGQIEVHSLSRCDADFSIYWDT